jgi:hypothetical protein
VNDGRLAECVVEFVFGHAQFRCSVEAGLSEVVRSFVQPPVIAQLADTPSTLLTVRRGRASSPASRGLPLTCAFGPADGFTAPGTVELWDGSTLVVARLDGSSVTALVGAESDLHFVGAVMIFAATALALRAHGLFHLHAACVVVPQIGTVLIVGESGSGKTTLALGLAALGGSLVSDDAVFLTRGPHGQADVLGWPADMHLGPATLNAFPALAKEAYRPVADGRDKRAVPLSSLTPSWLPRASRPELVLFPTIRPVTKSRVEVVDAPSTISQLIPQSGLVLVSGAPRPQEHFEVLAGIANDSVGLAITLGADALPPGSALMDLLRDRALARARPGGLRS